MTAAQKALAVVVGIATAMRVAAFLVYGPLYQPDSSSFTHAASLILQGQEWLSFADIDNVRGHDMTLRMLGYPLLIAGLKLIAGVYADHAVVALQSLCSIIATALVFRVSRAIDLGVAVSTFVALAYTSSIAFLFDFNVLVDSLFANGLLISACLITIGMQQCRLPAFPALLGIGFLLVVSFLVRETAVYFAPIWALGIVIWARQARASWSYSVICALIFILPVLLISTGYREWNRHRTGVPFLTTGAQMTMWFGPVEVARKKGTDLFADDPAIADAIGLALKTDTDFPMAGAVAINNYFFARALRSTDIADLAFKAYFMALRAAPVTLMIDRLSRYRTRAVLLLVNASMPLEVMKDFSEKRSNTAFVDRARTAIAAGGIEGIATLAWMALEVVQLAISAILLLAFAFGVPLLIIHLLWRNQHLDRIPLILGWFWCMYWGLNGAYILASFEGRYAIATLPLACMGGLWICIYGVQVFRAARNASYSRI